MKENILTLVIVMVASINLKAQDLIIKKNGEHLKVKVTLVSSEEIEYTRLDNMGAPIYKINTTEVCEIQYFNGYVEKMSEAKPLANTQTNDQKPWPKQGFYAINFFDKGVPLVFLGIDFSNCKLLGEGFDDPKLLFHQLNELLITERAKYDMSTAVRKKNLPYALELVRKRNENIVRPVIIEENPSLTELNNLQDIVDQYDMESAGINYGLALVIVCRKLDNVRQIGQYYYIVFDVASRNIVISDILIGHPAGKGIRNYWARSVYQSILTLDDKNFVFWKHKYNR